MMRPIVLLAVLFAVLFASSGCASCDDDATEYQQKIRACRDTCAADHRVMKSADKDSCICDGPTSAPAASASATAP
jgi:hypothetical protein